MWGKNKTNEKKPANLSKLFLLLFLLIFLLLILFLALLILEYALLVPLLKIIIIQDVPAVSQPDGLILFRRMSLETR